MSPMTPEALDEIARAQGVRFLWLDRAGGAGFVGQVPGPPGVVRVDLANPELFDQLDAMAFLDSMEGSGQVPLLVQQTGQQGVAAMREHEVPTAYLLYRFGLYVAVRTGELNGIESMMRNVWVARERIRNLTERARGPARTELGQHVSAEVLEAWKAELEGTLSMMARDVRALRPLLDARLARVDASVASHERIVLVHAAKRAADIMGDEARAGLIEEIMAAAQSLREWQDLVEVVLGEITQATVGNLLGLAREEARDASASTVVRAWELYQSVRHGLDELPELRSIVQLLDIAFGHLDSARVRMTAAGGAFGHQLSYSIAPLTRTIGRDLAHVQALLGYHEQAFISAEYAHARAMTDWMGRTHPIRLARQYYSAINPFEGSMNAAEPASAQQISNCAADGGAAVLFYLAHEGGYRVWLRLPDGQLLPGMIEEPIELLQELFRVLPYTSEGETLGRSRRTRGAGATPAATATLDRLMQELHDALMPDDIREALEGTTLRLVVIADGLLEFVPFAALRSSRGAALVEEREVHYWPSITAWHMVEPVTDGGAPGVTPVVVANSVFPDTYQVSYSGEPEAISFDALPGVLREGRVVGSLLGVEPLTDAEATCVALFELPRGVPVLHIATHGLLFLPHPEASFLAMADGPLSANALYRYDRGVRAGLVVLSACQTGLGHQHPDSQIGLANAFLVAGAHTVVSTLWEIPDDDTVVFMEAFYRQVKEGVPIPACVQAAQRALIAWGAPVESWGAFKATGRMASPALHNQATSLPAT